jgi:hypothetical protein
MLPEGSPHAAHGRGVFSVVGRGAGALDSVAIKSFSSWSKLRGIVAIPPGPFLYPTSIFYHI